MNQADDASFILSDFRFEITNVTAGKKLVEDFLDRRVGDGRRLCRLAGTDGVFRKGFLERVEFVGGEACHHDAVLQRAASKPVAVEMSISATSNPSSPYG